MQEHKSGSRGIGAETTAVGQVRGDGDVKFRCVAYKVIHSSGVLDSHHFYCICRTDLQGVQKRTWFRSIAPPLLTVGALANCLSF